MDREYVSGQGYVSPKRDRMPAIRIAEMYYIAAEALKDTDMPAALGLLNTLRIHRGLTEVKNLSKEELQQELEREYYREMIGEGQVFFYHKRMNTKMIVTGDMTQIDLPASQTSGLVQALRILKGVKGISFVELNKKDIVRHKLVERIVDAYEKFDKEAKAEREKRKNEQLVINGERPVKLAKD